MNKIRIPLIFTVIIYAIYRLLSYFLEDPYTPALVFLIPITMLALNLGLRKKLKNKNWFVGKWNILLDKKSFEFETDIPLDLLTPKIREVISETNFKLLDHDESSNDFLIGTSANFWTWGENIYISAEEYSDVYKIKVTSVTVFGSSSWGKNQEHFTKFSVTFEQSLTI